MCISTLATQIHPKTGLKNDDRTSVGAACLSGRAFFRGQPECRAYLAPRRTNLGMNTRNPARLPRDPVFKGDASVVDASAGLAHALVPARRAPASGSAWPAAQMDTARCVRLCPSSLSAPCLCALGARQQACRGAAPSPLLLRPEGFSPACARRSTRAFLRSNWGGGMAGKPLAPCRFSPVQPRRAGIPTTSRKSDSSPWTARPRADAGATRLDTRG